MVKQMTSSCRSMHTEETISHSSLLSDRKDRLNKSKVVLNPYRTPRLYLLFVFFSPWHKYSFIHSSAVSLQCRCYDLKPGIKVLMLALNQQVEAEERTFAVCSWTWTARSNTTVGAIYEHISS
ncbi:hypothetical protein Y1Q_0012868 [Alligator mississippiensis]|uniref:Uncharacterized protein n=1 Tax=Alligator mississippiensis TaxID=8496 RepID=A0A151P4P3_ALLMI|nr:hypothetical protein Y1Q_0012868 [Alligator mississippiensis]